MTLSAVQFTPPTTPPNFLHGMTHLEWNLPNFMQLNVLEVHHRGHWGKQPHTPAEKAFRFRQVGQIFLSHQRKNQRTCHLLSAARGFYSCSKKARLSAVCFYNDSAFREISALVVSYLQPRNL